MNLDLGCERVWAVRMTISWQTRALRNRLIWIKATCTSNVESVARSAGAQTDQGNSRLRRNALVRGGDSNSMGRKRQASHETMGCWLFEPAAAFEQPDVVAVDLLRRDHIGLLCDLARLLLDTESAASASSPIAFGSA